ncbi:MAG: hypothetical protein F6K50_29935 [Moorea sp. SIO3I7]|nr:hypothetical protein [Moorena sp. SIO3I7]
MAKRAPRGLLAKAKACATSQASSLCHRCANSYQQSADALLEKLPFA